MELQILPTISTSFIVISAVLVAIGWGLIIKRNVEGHKKVMLAAGVAHLFSLSSMRPVQSLLEIRLLAVEKI